MNTISLFYIRGTKMADHSGHRQRMKTRALNEGLEHFEAHELLELLLYPFIPYKDTNPIAHDLLDEFGSLESVFEASPDNLIKVKGMTQNASIYLSLMPEIFRRFSQSKLDKKTVLDTTDKLVRYLTPYLATRSREAVYMISLDTRYSMLGLKCLGSGVVNETTLHVRDIVEEALKRNAVSVVLAHNHPGGNTMPSQQDMDMTEDIDAALTGIGIAFMDHIIISPNGYYSFRKHGGYDLLYKDTSENVADKPHLYKNGEYDELFDLSQIEIDYGNGYEKNY